MTKLYPHSLFVSLSLLWRDFKAYLHIDTETRIMVSIGIGIAAVFAFMSLPFDLHPNPFRDQGIAAMCFLIAVGMAFSVRISCTTQRDPCHVRHAHRDEMAMTVLATVLLLMSLVALTSSHYSSFA